jgi:Zn-dependent protease
MLGGAGLGLGMVLHSPLLVTIGWINLVLAAFNLIPALPMDGGRILRALLTRKMDFVRATDVAATVARVTSGVFLVLGLMGAYQLVFLAPLLWIMAGREQMLARMMADQYAYTRDGYVARTPRFHGSGGAPEHPRRFTLRRRDGRFVVEEL